MKINYLFIRGFAFNLFGIAVPALIGLLFIPNLYRQLGAEKFGLLTLAWALLGYSSVFDFGLGTSVSRSVATKIAQEQENSVAPLINTVLVTQFLIGIFLTSLLLLLSGHFIQLLGKIENLSLKEMHTSMQVIFLCIPAIMTTNMLTGVLQAYRSYGLGMLGKATVGTIIFIGPTIIANYSTNMAYIFGSIVILRWLILLIHWKFVQHVITSSRLFCSVQEVKSLFKFGVGVTISSILGPIMIYCDRFILGHVLSLTNVTFYATPQEIALRLLAIPSAIVGILFPEFVNTLSKKNNFSEQDNKIQKKYALGFNLNFIFMFPICFIGILFSEEILTWWIDPHFSSQSSAILKVLLVAIFINSAAHIPFYLAYAGGKSAATAKLHIIELPIYLITLYFFIHQFGILGAAIAWLSRALFDFTCLTWLANKITGINLKRMKNEFFLTIFSIILLFFLAFTAISFESKISIFKFLFLLFLLFIAIQIKKLKQL